MGDYKNIALLSASTGIHKNTIGSRITKGMSKDEAISFKPIKKARPVTQMRVFIASNGAVEMDDALIDLILQVAKVENNKRLSRNTYDPKGNNDE